MNKRICPYCAMPQYSAAAIRTCIRCGRTMPEEDNVIVVNEVGIFEENKD